METQNNQVNSQGLWKIGILSLAVLAVVFFLVPKTHAPKGDIVKINEKTINVTMADTEEEQVNGLSGRESLGSDEGMLFVFNTPNKYGIWMKDMKFPIDIIWINENQEVVTIKENATPDTYPTIFGPKENSKYVLEVPAFYARDNSIEVGDRAEF